MLLRHGHMRPRPPRASLPTTASASFSHETSGPVSVSTEEVHVPATTSDDDKEASALALLHDRQRAVPRRISKNCVTIKRFGDRLSVRRRARHAERLVIQDVEKMRQTLAAMDQRLSLLDSLTLSMRHNAETAAIDMVRTYFRHMKYGLNPRDVVHDREITKPFLETIMAPDLKCQDFIGLHQFFKQWEYVTKYHAQIEMETSALVPLPADSNDIFGGDVLIIKATGFTHCRISRETLMHFFPHIIRDEALVQWLIGKQYSYGFTMVLHVNSAGRVFQFESQIDLTSGLLTLLNDPRITLQMIDSSMWTKGGNLRGEVQEEQIPIENGVLLA